MTYQSDAPARFSAAGLIVLATLAAYCNSFAGPFIFDDQFAIEDNPTIRQFWSIRKTLSPPNHGETVDGRPLLNFSLAVNYAISRLEVWSYHATNLAIHTLAALLLFGIIRRTLLLPALRDRWGAAAVYIALAIALLWAIHPLQTESVTYIVQRAESLVGLLYLLTLYCFIRGADSPRAMLWYAGSVIACLLGMASKEVMVSAPLMLLLYDRTFLAGSFAAAWRRRYGLYMALAGTWLLLGWLVISSGTRGGSAGFGIGISCWAYLSTQFVAIVHYLRLSVWPYPLVFYYGDDIPRNALDIAPCAVVVGLLGAATLVALWRWPKIGFLGAWFFAILAPSSSVFPANVKQIVAEHRMYLSLAAVITGLVLGGCLVGRWLVHRGILSSFASRVLGRCLVTATGVVLAILTFQRNFDYRSALSIWEVTLAHTSKNWMAHNNLGVALASHSRLDEAITHYRKCLEIKPDYAEAHNNLGAALAGLGQVDEAMAQYRQALEIKPGYAEAHNNLGNALDGRGQFDEAIAHYQRALKIQPESVAAHYNLGNALVDRGRFDEAVAEYRKALEIKPDCAEAHYYLGLALADRGSLGEAIAQYRNALEIKPDYAEAHVNLGVALAGRGQFDEADAHYRRALNINPQNADAHYNLGVALAGFGQFDEAMAHYQKALQIKPGFAEAHVNLGRVLAARRQFDEAIGHYQKALEIKPDFAEAHNNLGNVLAGRGQFEEAIPHYQKALQIKPDYVEAHNNLGGALTGLGHFDEAIAHFQKALEIKPNNVGTSQNLAVVVARREELRKVFARRHELLRSRPKDATLLNDTAWLLATNPNASVRNGTEAVELAQRAVELSDGKSPENFGTLAAAYAEAGRFAEALQTAHKALDMATQQNKTALAESIRAKIGLYEAGNPFRETRSSLDIPSANP